MKKIFCVLLSIVLCANIPSIAFAAEPAFSIEEVAVELINDALIMDYYQGVIMYWVEAAHYVYVP